MSKVDGVTIIVQAYSLAIGKKLKTQNEKTKNSSEKNHKLNFLAYFGKFVFSFGKIFYSTCNKNSKLKGETQNSREKINTQEKTHN